jgi:hypothetical protein
MHADPPARLLHLHPVAGDGVADRHGPYLRAAIEDDHSGQRRRSSGSSRRTLCVMSTSCSCPSIRSGPRIGKTPLRHAGGAMRLRPCLTGRRPSSPLPVLLNEQLVDDLHVHVRQAEVVPLELVGHLLVVAIGRFSAIRRSPRQARGSRRRDHAPHRQAASLGLLERRGRRCRRSSRSDVNLWSVMRLAVVTGATETCAVYEE